MDDDTLPLLARQSFSVASISFADSAASASPCGSETPLDRDYAPDTRIGILEGLHWDRNCSPWRNDRHSIMSESRTASSPQRNKELQAIYDGSAEGILIAEIGSSDSFAPTGRSVECSATASRNCCRCRSTTSIPPRDLPHVLDLFEAMSQRRLKCARDVPCLRKDGGVVYADITATHIAYHDGPCLLGFFHDVTEQKRAMEALRASEERYRLIADNVADVIWTVEFPPAVVERADGRRDVAATVDAILDQWRFSFVSPAAERLFQYTPEEIAALSLRDIVTPAVLRSRPRGDDRRVQPEHRRLGRRFAATRARTGISGQRTATVALVRSRQHVPARRPRRADGHPGNHPRRHAAS